MERRKIFVTGGFDKVSYIPKFVGRKVSLPYHLSNPSFLLWNSTYPAPPLGSPLFWILTKVHLYFGYVNG